MQNIIEELVRLASEKRYSIELIYVSDFKKLIGTNDMKRRIINSLSEIPENCDNNELFCIDGILYAKKNSDTLYQLEMDPIPFDFNSYEKICVDLNKLKKEVLQ